MTLTKTSKKAETARPVVQPLPSDPVYNLSAAASILDCNERILAEKFRQGTIKGWKKLGKWYTCHSSILEFIRS